MFDDRFLNDFILARDQACQDVREVRRQWDAMQPLINDLRWIRRIIAEQVVLADKLLTDVETSYAYGRLGAPRRL